MRLLEMANAARPYYKFLHEKMLEHFDAAEARALCFGLGIEYDDLQGEGRADKLVSLISFIERRGMIEGFIKEVTKTRPNVLWKQAPSIVNPLPLHLQDLADNNHAHVLFYQSLQCLERKVQRVVGDGRTFSEQVRLLDVITARHGGQLLTHSKILGELFTKAEGISDTFQRTRVLAAVAVSLAGLSLLMWLAVMMTLLWR